MVTQTKKPKKIPVHKLTSQKKIVEKQKTSEPTEKKTKVVNKIDLKKIKI